MSKPRLVFCSLFLAFAAALVLVAASIAGPAAKSAPFKAAWIYVGPHNDGGWSQAHDAARLYVQKVLGGKVQTTFKENVPEGPQVAQVINSLIRDGNKIIFATSFGFQPSMIAAARKNPGVYFEQATGTATSRNMAEYFGAGEDSTFLAGMAVKDHFVDIAPYGPEVTAATKAAIASKKAGLVSGKFYEFTGPLYDQSGKLRVPKGKKLTVQDLYAMNWLVKGVIGSATG